MAEFLKTPDVLQFTIKLGTKHIKTEHIMDECCSENDRGRSSNIGPYAGLDSSQNINIIIIIIIIIMKSCSKHKIGKHTIHP